VAEGNGKDGDFNQLDRSYRIYVDDNQTILIAGGNNRLDLLNSPMNVIVDKHQML
jgi:hypothetical protein